MFPRLPGRRLCVLVGIIVLCVVPSSLSARTHRREVNSIVLGQILPISGDDGEFGRAAAEGIGLAVEEANAGGGIRGVPLRVVVRDARGGRLTGAVTAQILTEDRPVALLGPAASVNALAAAPLAQSAGVVMMATSATNARVTPVGDYIFRACFIDTDQAVAMATFATERLHARTAAVLADVQSNFSLGLAQVFADGLRASGGEVREERYARGDIEYGEQLARLLTSPPDVLYVPGYFPDIAPIARQAREAGYTGPVLGADGWQSATLETTALVARAGAWFTRHYEVADPNPINRAFIEQYRNRYQHEPGDDAALGYDAANLVIAALTEIAADPAVLGALTQRSRSSPEEQTRARQALRDALAKTAQFPGVTGPITIGPDRNPIKPVVVVRVTPTGWEYDSTVSR